MSAPIHTTTDWQAGHYDLVIDVRSPSEFADDHIPGAINLPALSDEQRAVVGTLYKQTSAFEARKTGAAIMSRNIAHHIETVLKDKPAGFRPLIHCWRGGSALARLRPCLKRGGLDNPSAGGRVQSLLA